MGIYSIHDFVTCQRPDGSTYGTSGTCRKGVEISRMETGVFSVKDAQGDRVGSILAEDALIGGGGIREKGRQSRYTVLVNNQKREGLTLAQAKTQAKEWLGEKTRGDAKVAIKGGLTERGKAKRLENLEVDVKEIREKFNKQVAKWNATPEEERKLNPNLRKNIEFLKGQYEALVAEREMVRDTPVVG
jgi:hypothetical protein